VHETVSRFLSSQATKGVKASTISRRCERSLMRKLAGHREPPCNAETVKAVMRGIRRSIGTAPVQKAPATADVIGEMLEALPRHAERQAGPCAAGARVCRGVFAALSCWPSRSPIWSRYRTACASRSGGRKLTRRGRKLPGADADHLHTPAVLCP